MTDNVNHPKHYEAGPSVTIECIDVARHLPFARGNAFKYVWRCGKKGGPEQAIEDLEKALWYLGDDRELDMEQDCYAAKAVFSLIPVGTDIRYFALRDIVNGNDIAWERVSSWLEYLKTKHLEVQE